MNINELSAVTGVSTRNIKRFIHERLLAPPDGKTRAARYSDDHRRDLLRIRSLQSGGWTIEQIRDELRTDRGEKMAMANADRESFEAVVVEHRYSVLPGVYVVFAATDPRRTEQGERRLVDQIRAVLMSTKRQAT